MNSSRLTVVPEDGGVVFWDSGPAPCDILRARLDAIDMAQFAPNPRSPVEALKVAMREYAGSDDVRIEAHKNRKRDGYELVDVDRDVDENFYEQRFSCKLDGSEAIEITRGVADRLKLQELYDKHRDETTGGKIGQSLKNILFSLHATTIRESGGLYYLPQDSVEKWEQVVNIFEAAGANTFISTVKIVLDTSSVRAIQQALTREMRTAYDVVVEEIINGEIGEQALENRITVAKELLSRAMEYEAILGEELQDAKEWITKAKQAASSALVAKDSSVTFDEMYQ